MGFVSQIEFNNTKYQFHDSEFIVDNRNSGGAALTGVSKASALFDGMQITYWLNNEAGENATLNLALAGGTTTGAIPCYYGETTRLGTQYPAGNIIHFTYRTNVTIGTTTIAQGWWADAQADLSNHGVSVSQVLWEGSQTGNNPTGITVADPAGYDYFLVTTNYGTFPVYPGGASGYISGGTITSAGGGSFYIVNATMNPDTSNSALWYVDENAYFYKQSGNAFPTDSTSNTMTKITGIRLGTTSLPSAGGVGF